MSQIEIIHLSLKDYCEFLGDSNYYFRNNATSRMYIKDNKIWKFDDWEFFSTESPVINYRKELERLNVNVPRELIYLEDNYVGYTISFINGFDLATPVYPLRILEFISKDALYDSYQQAKEHLNEIGELGFDISGDLNDRNIMFDFDTHQFYFIDFDFWKYYELDTQNNTEDLMMLKKIKKANEKRFEHAIVRSKILEKVI